MKIVDFIACLELEILAEGNASKLHIRELFMERTIWSHRETERRDLTVRTIASFGFSDFVHRPDFSKYQ
jgi:hypothetical protein